MATPTAAEIARLTGYDRTHVTRALSGQRPATLRLALAIALTRGETIDTVTPDNEWPPAARFGVLAATVYTALAETTDYYPEDQWHARWIGLALTTARALALPMDAENADYLTAAASLAVIAREAAQ